MTVKSRSVINSEADANIQDNTAQEITPADVRQRIKDLADSSLNPSDDKDASGKYAGLTLFKINFKNALGSIVSFFTNVNTAARTYLFPDKDITVAGIIDIQNGAVIYLTASGTNTYTGGLTPALTSYVAGQLFKVKFTNGNTGSSTLNIDSLGALTLKKNVSTNLASGDIPAGAVLLLLYDGTNLQVVGIASGGSSGITIGSTVIVGGAPGNLLLEKSDNTVTEDNNISWDGSKFTVVGNIEGKGGTLYISAIYGGNVGTPSPVVIRASASPIMRLETTGVYVGSNSSAASNLAVEAIAAAKAYTVGGKDKEFYLDSGNAIATGETDLYVRTFEARLFGSNGDTASFDFIATVIGAATITKRLKLYFGGTNVYDSTAQVFLTNDIVRLSGKIIRVSSSVVRVYVAAQLSTGVAITLTNYISVTGLTLSNTNIFKLTGESAGVGSNNNDIVAKMGYIRVEEVSQ